jgi:hypothetical protein
MAMLGDSSGTEPRRGRFMTAAIGKFFELQTVALLPSSTVILPDFPASAASDRRRWSLQAEFGLTIRGRGPFFVMTILVGIADGCTSSLSFILASERRFS